MKNPDEMGRLPVARTHLLHREEYPELVGTLVDRGLVRMCAVDEYAGCPDNGVFGILKQSNGKQRLILDNRPGNGMSHGMRALQARYTELLEAFPERAVAMKLPKRLMEISSPSDLAQLPAGAVSKTVSDFSNYFHQLLALPCMLRAQCMPAVDLGGGEGLQRPVYVALPMGGWISALLAHIAHKHMVRSLSHDLSSPLAVESVSAPLARTLRFRQPGTESAGFSADLAQTRERADDNGLVSLADLPPSLRERFMEMAGVEATDVTASWLADFRCPVSAVSLEPAGEADPPERCIFVDSHILGDAGFDGVLAEARRREARGGKAAGWLFNVLSVVYIDDRHSLLYPPARASGRTRASWFCVGDAQHLAAVLHAAAHGCEQNTSKLVWSSSETTSTIGVDEEFRTREAGFPLRLAVAPAKREAAAAKIRALLSSGATHVGEAYFDHLVGKVVWQVLVRRSWLSIFDLVFRARHAKSRPDGLVWLSPRLRTELSMLVDLMPLMEAVSRPLSDLMFIFDASGVNRLGNGGYGVVRRGGVTEEVATAILDDNYGRLPRFRVGPHGEPPVDTPQAALAADFVFPKWELGPRKQPWSVLRSGEFKRPTGHVNYAEAQTGNMTVRCAAREPTVRGKRVLIGGDNEASLGALRKGRSTAFQLNGVCRRYAALSFVFDFEAVWFWLPSKANPADAPSRWWMRGRERGWLEDKATTGVPPHPGPPRRAHPFRAPQKLRVVPEETGKLASFSITAESLNKYLTAWLGFGIFIRATSDRHADFATALEAYVQMAWESEIIPKADCTQLLTGIAFVMPEFKAAGKMTLAWRALSGWGKLVPTKSWNPITWPLLLFFATLLAWNGEVDAAVALVLSFHVYGRGGEITGLRDSDVCLPGDLRGQGDVVGAVLFFCPKAQRMQSVIVDHPLVLALLALQRGRNVRRGQTGGRFFPDLAKTGKRSLLSRFKRAQCAAGLTIPLWVRHSCRHGGATFDHAHRVPPRAISDIAIRGRWSSLKALKIYLQDCQAKLLDMSFPEGFRRRVAAMGDPTIALRRALGI
jgi:hypothetical protein